MSRGVQMDIAKMLGMDVNFSEIEKKALEAKQAQVDMLDEIRKMNVKLDRLVVVADQLSKWIMQNR